MPYIIEVFNKHCILRLVDTAPCAERTAVTEKAPNSSRQWTDALCSDSFLLPDRSGSPSTLIEFNRRQKARNLISTLFVVMTNGQSNNAGRLRYIPLGQLHSHSGYFSECRQTTSIGIKLMSDIELLLIKNAIGFRWYAAVKSFLLCLLFVYCFVVFSDLFGE